MEFANLTELAAYAGKELPASVWLKVDQRMIDSFADATGDHQWVHTDKVRAARESPFGTTIAHGFLSLSLLSKMLMDQVELQNLRMGVNYGLSKIRFTSVVKEGSRLRLHTILKEFEPIPSNGAKLTFDCKVELEGQEKPALVGEFLVIFYEKTD
jgi:acyl dehydratase